MVMVGVVRMKEEVRLRIEEVVRMALRMLLSKVELPEDCVMRGLEILPPEERVKVTMASFRPHSAGGGTCQAS